MVHESQVSLAAVLRGTVTSLKPLLWTRDMQYLYCARHHTVRCQQTLLETPRLVQRRRAAPVGIVVFCAPSFLCASKQQSNDRKQLSDVSPPPLLCVHWIGLSLGLQHVRTSDFKDCCLGRWLVFRLKKIIKRREVSAVERRDWSARGSEFSSSQAWWLSTVCSSSSV